MTGGGAVGGQGDGAGGGRGNRGKGSYKRVTKEDKQQQTYGSSLGCLL